MSPELIAQGMVLRGRAAALESQLPSENHAPFLVGWLQMELEEALNLIAAARTPEGAAYLKKLSQPAAQFS